MWVLAPILVLRQAYTNALALWRIQTMSKVTVEYSNDHIRIQFAAMNRAGEFLIEGARDKLTDAFTRKGIKEIIRIEKKFSYRVADSITHIINQADGLRTPIDSETYTMMEYANQLHELSHGLFDATSKSLSDLWPFRHPSKPLPTQLDIQKTLRLVGWEQVKFAPDFVYLPKGMQIDFGAILKEYAVSKVARLAAELLPDRSVLVNLGSDIEISRPRKDNKNWHIEIKGKQSRTVAIKKGALATSGDREKYVEINGKRFSNVINPLTGWPIKQSISTVTVSAKTCMEAGSISTLALLQGKGCEAFLQKQQNIKYVLG